MFEEKTTSLGPEHDIIFLKKIGEELHIIILLLRLKSNLKNTYVELFPCLFALIIILVKRD